MVFRGEKGRDGFNLHSYIAFHDGPVPPHAVGVLLGIVFFVLPSIVEVRKANVEKFWADLKGMQEAGK